jgi:hypothetical protein
MEAWINYVDARGRDGAGFFTEVSKREIPPESAAA